MSTPQVHGAGMRRVGRWFAGASLAAGIMIGGFGMADAANAAPATEPNPPAPSIGAPAPVAGKAAAVRVVISDGNVLRARAAG